MKRRCCNRRVARSIARTFPSVSNLEIAWNGATPPAGIPLSDGRRIVLRILRTMKKSVTALLAVLLLPLSALAATWKGDPAHSRLSFAVTHLGISEITGAFKSFEVLIKADKPDFSDAVFDLSVDVASIDTEVEKRDNHLKSPDFFEVEKFPKMTFRSKSIEAAGKDRYKLSGDLTIHGQTKPVQMELWYRGTTTNQKNTTAGFQLTGTLKRSDFGVGPKFPEPMISDEVKIKADGEFIKQP